MNTRPLAQTRSFQHRSALALRLPSPSELSWTEAGAVCLAVASRHSASSADAEDAAQEALLRAWKARDRCASAIDPVAYVAGIARNEALRLLERRTRQAEVPLEGEPSRFSEDSALVAVVERAAIDAALEHVSGHERRLLLLSYVEDLTQPGIARALDMPEGTVKVQLHRARHKFRKALAAAPPGS